MASVQKILIVGGGIAGMVAAVALHQKDFDVEIVEVNPKWDVYGVGIIQLANSMRALATVGLADQVLAAGFGMDKVGFYDHDGNLISEIPQPRPAGPHYPAANALTRPRLHKILQDAVREAGVNVRVGVTVSELVQMDDAVEVTFTDWTTGRYDLVIGVDGIRSLIRSLVFGTSYQPGFAGQMCWRYNVPRPPEVDNFQMFLGPSGNKAGFVPLAPDLMYIFLTETPREQGNPWPRIREQQLAEVFREERLAEAFRERLMEFGGPVARIRDNDITDASKVVYRPFETILVPPPWYRGRVVLFGDAAHAMTAHIAQGAAMAIEDAVVLADELATKPALLKALYGYMERRYERCKSLVEISMELCRGGINNDRTVDVPGLTARSIQIAAAPI
jgi:2-polyprenyl-6-methoxyphenol hydroxylase-like FAD-dependent oxidoreductase